MSISLTGPAPLALRLLSAAVPVGQTVGRIPLPVAFSAIAPEPFCFVMVFFSSFVSNVSLAGVSDVYGPANR